MQRLIFDTLAFCRCTAVMYSVSLTSSGSVSFTGGLCTCGGDSFSLLGVTGRCLVVLAFEQFSDELGDEMAGCVVLLISTLGDPKYG